MRAVCYARVSSVGQRERDTIASQLRVLPEFVERQGWTLAKPVETYVDDGRTARAGHLDARTGLTALLRDAALKLFDVVCVVNVDRLTRSEDMTERFAILGALQRAGVRVATVSTGMVSDLNNPMGELMTTLGAYFAAEESRIKTQRTNDGKQTAAMRGHKPQGPTPFGLAYSRETKLWSIDPVRGPILVEIFERVADGESARSIASDFNARGVPAPRQLWERGRIQHLIRSRHAIGEWCANREKRLVIKVPAIVSLALFVAANEALTQNRLRPLRAHTKHVYLLERAATCSECGATIAIRSKVHSGPATSWYICRRRREELQGGRRCLAPTVKVSDADERVWEALCEELLDPTLPARLLEESNARRHEERDWQADIAGYRRHLARLEKAEAAIVGRFRRGLITEKVFDGELAAMTRERSMLEGQIETAERAAKSSADSRSSAEELRAMVDGLRQLAEDATPEERRELARLLIEPGSAVFRGQAIHFTMRIRRRMSAVSEERSCRRTLQTDHAESSLRIRKVA